MIPRRVSLYGTFGRCVERDCRGGLDEYIAAGMAVVDELDVSDHLMDLIHWEFEEQQYLDLTNR